jgi:hypothetical protein
MIWVRTGGPEGGGGGGGRGNLPLPDQPRPLSTVGCK